MKNINEEILKGAKSILDYAKRVGITNNELRKYDKYEHPELASADDPELESSLLDIFVLLKKKYPQYKYTITAGDDKHHERTSSKHDKGLAIDFKINDSSDEAQYNIEHGILEIILNNEIKIPSGYRIGFLNEYKYKSRRSSGSHFHISLVPLNSSKEFYFPLHGIYNYNDFIRIYNKEGKELINKKNTQHDTTGKNSEAIKLQTELVKYGYRLPKYGIDGKIGPETRNAIINFQKDSDIETDGIPGPETKEAIYEKMYGPVTYTMEFNNITYNLYFNDNSKMIRGVPKSSIYRNDSEYNLKIIKHDNNIIAINDDGEKIKLTENDIEFINKLFKTYS